MLVKAAATHVSLVNGACVQLSSENTTARQLGQATPRLSEKRFSFLFIAAKFRCMSEIWHHRHQERLSLNVAPRLNPISEKRASAHLEKKNTHRTVEECHVTKDLLLDGIRKRKCMSKIWRPKTSHKDEALNKNCKTRNMPKKRTLKIPAVQSLKCPTVR